LGWSLSPGRFGSEGEAMKFNNLLLVLVLGISGCARVDNNLSVNSRQIVDLVNAHKCGVISTAEYTELRKRLMKTMLR
jgi:hypothetical protein